MAYAYLSLYYYSVLTHSKYLINAFRMKLETITLKVIHTAVLFCLDRGIYDDLYFF
jgi:hypothetical protein